MKLESHLALTPRFMHVVPFLGVVMLLMTFFLLGSSMVRQSGIAIHAPTSSSLLDPVPGAAVVTISAGREPQLYFNDRPVSLKDLDKALGEAPEKSRQVLIRADELAALGQVVKVSEMARRRGYEVIVATLPDESVSGRGTSP